MQLYNIMKRAAIYSANQCRNSGWLELSMSPTLAAEHTTHGIIIAGFNTFSIITINIIVGIINIIIVIVTIAVLVDISIISTGASLMVKQLLYAPPLLGSEVMGEELERHLESNRAT